MNKDASSSPNDLKGEDLKGEDFRSRVAAEKRDRMHSRLLAATMDVCGGPGGTSAVVIDDVIKAAGVSRGAFYRHFQSLEDATGQIVDTLISEIVTTATTDFEDVKDPVLGSAIGSQLLLFRAAMDHRWARFVSSNNLILSHPALSAVLRRTIADGGRKGVFQFDSVEAATDLYAGTLLAAVHRLGGMNDVSRAYIREISMLLLRGLGAGEPEARQCVQQAEAKIEAVATSRLAWWSKE